MLSREDFASRTRRVRGDLGSHRRKAMPLLGAVAVSVLILGACSSSNRSTAGAAGSARAGGSSTTTANSGIAATQAAFANAQKPVSGFTAPGPAFDASKAKGKTVWYLALSYSDPFFHAVGSALQAALSSAGVSLNICDGKGNPSNVSQCMLQAIGAHAGAIVADGLGPSLIGSATAQAHAAGIPVIEGDLGDPTSTIDPGATAVVSTPHTAIGKLLGQAVLALEGDKANVLVVSTNDVPSGKLLAENGAAATINAACPGCSTTLVDVPISQWSTQIQADVQAKLVANPNINVIVAAFDSMTPFILPAIDGKSIKVVTQNANLAEMQDLASGKGVAVEIGSDPNWEGWAYADQALRVMTGQPPVVESIPLRAFTSSNISELTIDAGNAASQNWYGGATLSDQMQSGFKKLWGLAG